MRIAFRSDASIQIGTGHVMRCLTLADALRAQGHECVFICRDHPGSLAGLIAQKGFEVHLLEQEISFGPGAKEGAPVAHADWLGVSWQQDVEETRTALLSMDADWLVVDHYALDFKWESGVADCVENIMAIDDLADRPHRCQILLDQNLGREPADYDGLIPGDCVRLIGPEYALLRPEFALLRERSLRRRQTSRLKRILITLGGVDRDNFTEQVLEALANSQLPSETELDIVMGASAPGLAAVREKVGTLRFSARVSVNVSDMAERMCLADLCVGAAGSTSWERCCLGLATILLVLAENQQSSAKALWEAGAALIVQRDDNIQETLPRLVNRLLVSGEILGISKSASAITDGRGTSLVVEAMSEPAGVYE